jgi:transcriptional regulator with XRE-family HTH domain/quercetin dioxygenase-like cupin family protein
MPVFSTHLLDYKGLGIGRRIREERQRKGYTLRELAAQIGTSEPKLSNIETGKVSLDLAELSQIARALDTSLPTFFPRDRVYHYFIKHTEEISSEIPIVRPLVGPEPGPTTHHNPVWPLAQPFVGKHMEPLLAQIKPLPDDELHFIGHDHEEFMFVLRGEVETLLKTNEAVVKEHLRPGDCMYFRSNLPHCHRSATAEPAETINVIYSLRGAIDPDDGELRSDGRRFYRRGVYTDATREAAEKIVLLRRSHGATLAELARATGIGVRQLADIESGKKAVDIELLLRLARHFRRPIEYFFATTLGAQPCYFVQRGGEITLLPVQHRKTPIESRGDKENVYRPLATGFPDRGLHPYYVQVKGGASEHFTLHEHHGQEFIYVLDGEIELVTRAGDEELIEPLRPGDSVFLDSSVPHLMRGRSRNPYADTTAQVIDVFWSPLGESYLFSPIAAETIREVAEVG